MSWETELQTKLASGNLPKDAQTRVLAYYRELVRENEVQNLTRLISPEDFLSGHLEDVLQLEKTGWITQEALDLGSGCGVPGFLAACVKASERWTLAESELRKREFLQNTVSALSLGDRVTVVSRGEEYLRRSPISTIVVRAVGRVAKLFSILDACSTWNTLILFKGPSWDEEWAEFQQAVPSEKRSALQIVAKHEYFVGAENKKRVLIKLTRVPRGTKR